jgi:hypothetical protein
MTIVNKIAAVTTTGQHSLRGKLALTTAIATLAFSYAGRNAYAGSCTGAALGAGLTWQTEIVTFGGTREALRLTVTEGESLALPEPTGGLLLGLGLAGLMGMKRRKQG